MFSLIRGAIIVGLIVYFSPLREGGEPEPQSAGTRPPPLREPSPAGERSEERDRLMGRLAGSLTEEVVRTAVSDKTQTGLRLKEQVASYLAQQAPKAASAVVLRPTDRAGPSPSVRCVYRCDGSE